MKPGRREFWEGVDRAIDARVKSGPVYRSPATCEVCKRQVGVTLDFVCQECRTKSEPHDDY